LVYMGNCITGDVVGKYRSYYTDIDHVLSDDVWGYQSVLLLAGLG
jgi:hypothetical protein